jgi:hypothetical protein
VKTKYLLPYIYFYHCSMSNDDANSIRQTLVVDTNKKTSVIFIKFVHFRSLLDMVKTLKLKYTRDVRKVHILLHFLLYNNTYVVQILSAKIYISSEHIYQKLLNCDLCLYFYCIYIQHIYIVMEHFDNVKGVNLILCLSTIQFLPI